MTTQEIVKELKSLGSASVRKVLCNHGAQEPVFGVKVGDLKRIQKRIKTDHALALGLYDTGIYDAMYLAGLIADDARMTKADLDRWVKTANGGLEGSVVPWVAAGSGHAVELALQWIESDQEHVAVAGWVTLSSLVSIRQDSELDLAELQRFLTRVEKTIHQQPNHVRYAMNGFVIALGTNVQGMTESAIQAAEKIGCVRVGMGNTACQVPDALDHIQQARKRGSIGKKRRTAKC